MSTARHEAVFSRIFGYLEDRTDLRAYAILDGARDERIHPALTEAVSERDYRCLYLGHKLIFLGKMPPVLARAAPYLVRLRKTSNFTRWMISRGWGDCWGIFFLSTAALDPLMNHFRRFLMVKDESGKTFYFRYYDPRVLRIYLPTCSQPELETIFGPVERFFCEDENADTLLEFSRRQDELRRQSIGLLKVQNGPASDFGRAQD